MARPTVPGDLTNGAQGWDADYNDMKDQAFATPFPVVEFADFATLEASAPANLYDWCLATTADTGSLWISTGTAWVPVRNVSDGPDGSAVEFGAGAGIVGNMKLSGALAGANVIVTGMVPARRRTLGIAGIVTTLISGPPSFNVGDGIDPDRYGAGISNALNTTFASDDHTADPTGWLSIPLDITLSAVGPNFGSGEVRLVAFYEEITPPSS